MMPLRPVASMRTLHCCVTLLIFFPALSVLYLAEWVSVSEPEVVRGLLLSFCLTPQFHCLSPAWSSPRPVPACPLGFPCCPWAGGRSNAARCGGFLPTRSTFPMWCQQAVTWRFEASLMPHMSLEGWLWTPPSERAGRGNSQWQWMLGQCREQKTLQSSPLNAPACLFWHRPSAGWNGSWKEPPGQRR